MSTFLPPVGIGKPNSGQGGGGVHPPVSGGGDDGRGDGPPNYERRLYRARLGLILGLASISVLFVTVTVVFLVMRHGAAGFNPRSDNYVPEWIQVTLPVRILLVNTLVLLLGSVTIERACWSAARELALEPIRSLPGIALERERRVPWLAVTVALGVLFLAGQWKAWETVRMRGFHISTLSPAPFFYILTGAHAVHLAGGIFVLLYAGVISLLHRPVELRRIVVEVARWYWHFMGALWVYIFALLHFGQ